MSTDDDINPMDVANSPFYKGDVLTNGYINDNQIDFVNSRNNTSSGRWSYISSSCTEEKMFDNGNGSKVLRSVCIPSSLQNEDDCAIFSKFPITKPIGSERKDNNENIGSCLQRLSISNDFSSSDIWDSNQQTKTTWTWAAEPDWSLEDINLDQPVEWPMSNPLISSTNSTRSHRTSNIEATSPLSSSGNGPLTGGLLSSSPFYDSQSQAQFAPQSPSPVGWPYSTGVGFQRQNSVEHNPLFSVSTNLSPSSPTEQSSISPSANGTSFMPMSFVSSPMSMQPPGFASEARSPPTFATVANNAARPVPAQTMGLAAPPPGVAPINAPMRNQLLEEFRQWTASGGGQVAVTGLSRGQFSQLSDLRGSVCDFARDQFGSRFIQLRLENASDSEKAAVFEELLPEASRLMVDVFGNYVIQKFFEYGTASQRRELMKCLQNHVIDFAMQMYGCRVIQKALESVDEPGKQRILQELAPHVMRCVKDQNGNHVIQKCIECVRPHELNFIIGAFKGHVVLLSRHSYGCRVIQRILEYCLAPQTQQILEEMHEGVEELVKDQYGNYVIQHVLMKGSEEDKRRILLSLRGKVAALSMHKFASNVMEKAIVHASMDQRAQLINEVLKSNDADSALLTLIKDQYANYVIQRMIELAQPSQKDDLVQRIKAMQGYLKRVNFAKHILTKLDKIDTTTNGNSSSSNTNNNNSSSSNNTTTNNNNNGSYIAVSAAGGSL